MRVRGIRRACLCLLLSLVLLGTGGCRQRVHPGHQSAGAGEQDKQELLPNDSAHSSQGSEQLDGGQTQPIQETDLSGQPDEPDGHAETRENPESTRREYDAAANADIRAGEPHRIQSPGDGSGFFEYASDGLSSVARLNAQADKSATQLTFVEESDRVSATETGDAAESALEYYRLLLAERTESLFECKKKVCYLEMPEKYVTIHKSSQMHALITKAGMYSVSARLRDNDLVVDAGWIVRKNPDMIVKIVSAGLAENGFGHAEADRILQEIRTREGFDGITAVRNRLLLVLSEDVLQNPYTECAGALILASQAYPELFEDVDLSAALGMLRDESGMDLVLGYYSGRDGGRE